MYAFTVTPYLTNTHSKSEKEEDINSPPPKKLQKNPNKTKQNKILKTWNVLFP